jgi:hypothetical protein
LGDADLIQTRPRGYLISVPPDRVDAARFDDLLRKADLAADPATEADLLAAALGVWRGPALADVPSEVLHRDEVPALAERRLRALERRIELQLRAERHAEVVPELRELTAKHPLRERLWAQLMTALAGCGRLGEALQAYEHFRARLVEELGIDPSPQLQELHRAALRGELTTTATGRGESRPPQRQRWLPPAQLPANVAGFSGRARYLSRLQALLEDHGTDPEGPSEVVISAITGPAGVGKTTLALHWAHQVADRFPDGQLYVNLKGFHRSGNAMAPAEALRGFLAALGVPPDRLPSDLDSLVGLYRSRLAGRRILVLLDNARDADQVRPLLPGSPTCLAIVTSRDQLVSLVATEAARLLVLDLLSPDEAHTLLARRLGADRLAAEPAATSEIITRCARLPLALAIVAARAITCPDHPLEALAADLRDPHHGTLAALTTGDASTDIRAVFSGSYRTLSPAAARLFRLLALHRGPDIDRTAAASLAALPAHQVRGLLGELTRVHLLTERSPGGYAFHDLLRAFASELCETHDPEEARRDAQARMLDRYLHPGYAGEACADIEARDQPGTTRITVA